MKKSHQNTDQQLQVIKLNQPDGQQMSLLVVDEQILCYQSHPDSPWEPVEPEYLGLALSINSM